MSPKLYARQEQTGRTPCSYSERPRTRQPGRCSLRRFFTVIFYTPNWLLTDAVEPDEKADFQNCCSKQYRCRDSDSEIGNRMINKSY